MALEREQVLEKVKQIIAEQCSADPQKIEASSQLDTVGADSLDRVEIVITLEETFNVEISDEAADQITTIGGFVDYIMEHASA